MTQASVVEHRGALWVAELQDWGYEIQSPTAGGAVEGHLAAAARRSKEFGLPHVEITIREVWLPGPDPAGVSPVVEGCHLHAHSWQAQFDPAGGENGGRAAGPRPQQAKTSVASSSSARSAE